MQAISLPKIAFRLDLMRRREAHAKHAVDAYLVHRYLADTLLPSRYVTNGESLFYLKHMDDKGDHILVDDDFNITAIIDWEWAQTTSKVEAFCAPVPPQCTRFLQWRKRTFNA